MNTSGSAREEVLDWLDRAVNKAIDHQSLILELRARRDIYLFQRKSGSATEEKAALKSVLAKFNEGSNLPEITEISDFVNSAN